MPYWEKLCKRRALKICRFVWTHYSNRFSSSRLWPWRAGTRWPVVFRPFPVIGREMLVSEYQFCRYLLFLLDDKEQEKVFDRMSKVMKAFTSCARPERFGESGGFGQRRPRSTWMKFIRCYACQGYGEYTRNCRVRSPSRETEQTPEAKRGGWSENRK